MLVAGFDVETTGLSTEKDWIVEAAVVLWDTAGVHRKAILEDKWFLKGPHLQPLSEEVIAIHGITDETIQKYGQPAEYVLRKINAVFEQVDAIVAHNGNLFDRPIYESMCKRLSLEPVEGKLWIDTTCDIEYPTFMPDRKLIHLAAHHKFLNPFPHSAASDVLTMLKIADQYDWDKIFEFAKSPAIVIRADVAFQQKELAKKQSFRWNADNKTWTKTIKTFQFDDAKKAAEANGFKITIVKG